MWFVLERGDNGESANFDIVHLFHLWNRVHIEALSVCLQGECLFLPYRLMQNKMYNKESIGWMDNANDRECSVKTNTNYSTDSNNNDSIKGSQLTANATMVCFIIDI